MRKNNKKILKEFKNLAKIIDNEIEVQFGDIWVSTPLFKLVEICKTKDKKDFEIDFSNYINTLLPNNKKHLAYIIPIYIWSFLHECGHVNNYDIKEHKISLRNLVNFLSYHFGQHKTIDRLTTYIYFRMKEERKATKWAVNYTLKNEDLILKYSQKLAKAYNDKKTIKKLQPCK